MVFLPQLPNEEEPEESPQVAADAPPPYSSIAAENAGKALLLKPSLKLVFYYGSGIKICITCT